MRRSEESQSAEPRAWLEQARNPNSFEREQAPTVTLATPATTRSAFVQPTIWPQPQGASTIVTTVITASPVRNPAPPETVDDAATRVTTTSNPIVSTQNSIVSINF